MALTPDDVVTKQFQHVRFKEGFDPDEVDDFLDEIVVEWRKTIAENDELKAKLAAYESGSEAPAAAAPAEVVAEAPAPVSAAQVSDAGQGAAAPAAASAGIIELAQRLHDEHVAEGIAQRDKLIADAQVAGRVDRLRGRDASGREEIARLDQERAASRAASPSCATSSATTAPSCAATSRASCATSRPRATTSGSTPVSAIGL